MKKLTLIALAILLSFAVFHSCNEPLTEDAARDELSLKSSNGNGVQSYIVVLNDAELNLEISNLKGYEKKQEAMKNASAKILKRAGITDGQIKHVYGSAITGFSVMIPPGQLKKLQDDPSVKYIEEDQVVTLVIPLVKPNKGKPGSDPGTGTTTQEIPWGITRVGGGATYKESQVAWIIDTGIDLDHPDLNVDVSASQSFLGGKDANNPDDLNGHGTHVAGTIAAVNNDIGVVGVAAGATVVSVRVLDRRGSGSYSGVIAGVDYVGANGENGDVANMSLGGPPSDALDDAVIAASSLVKFVLAAGNESDDANNHSPARVNGTNVYTISAMDSSDKWAYFSNYGNPPIDYCAPGYGIKSTYKNGGYATLSGTSMAAPHVAGLLLLGSIRNGGTVNGDPDRKSDVIAIH